MPPAPLAIGFHGAARTVTGSRHLLRFGTQQWLVDCGLYQGHRDEADRINRHFAFAPNEIDGVLVTHAHLDHTGNLPTLVNQGFRGPIHMTRATADLSRVMLQDSAFLMQKDIEHVNRHHGRGRPPRRPLYTLEDVEDTQRRIEDHRYDEPFSPMRGMTVRYRDAGHILGSAYLEVTIESDGRTRTICFGGDTGRYGRPILRDPQPPTQAADVLVLESTYGDRLHADEASTTDELVAIITRTIQRGGRVVVPAFAVGRTQELVAVLHGLIEAKRLPDVPLYVDSPMARNATAVFVRHPECFDDETRAQFARGDGAPFGFHRLRYIGTPDESRALNEKTEPCIILSASGMCEGGRVLHHLQHALGDARNTVLFVGFQGEGTLGRRLREGAKQVNVFGEPVLVRAEITGLDGFSAHADQNELLRWVASFPQKPRRIFLVHGELAPAETLAAKLRESTGAEVRIPEKGEESDLWT